MDEARSLQYSINITADTAQAESNIRNLTSSLGNLQENGNRVRIEADSSGAESGIRNVKSSLDGMQTQASSVGAAFRSSFLEGIDSGNSFSSSLKSGVGNAFSYVGGKASEFAGNVVSTAQGIKNGFEHPIETIKSGLGNAIQSAGNAIQSAKDRFVDLMRSADQAAEGIDEVDNSSGDARKSVSEMGDAAEESGGKFEKLGSVLKGAGTAIGVAAAAGAVALGKEVVSSFADYEQLVGGVDTLFGGASKTVQNFAANAFQTSGMAANDYMELVTSFSASLIQSLGGDTAAAATAADTAITDMADNSNKMGTSLESIQNAYRGFSMQNYTMLDSLKLGYGGTQAEMERLLSDAEKLSGVKYDISSFSDITEAIHVIQTEMGITGTTAKEAAETISGSWSSTKSAVQNLITGLGQADADFGMLVGNVANNFSNVIKNVTPVIENMVSQMPVVIETLIPVIADTVGMVATIIIENLPLLVDTLASVISSLITGLGEALPELLQVIVEALGAIVTTLIDNLPLLIDAGMQLLMGLTQGLVGALPMLIEQLPVIITGIVGFINANLSSIVMTGINILLQLAAGIIQAIPQLVAQLPQIISAIVSGIKALMGSVISVGRDIVTGIWQGISGAASWLKSKVTGLFSGIVSGVKNLLGIHSPSRVFADIGDNMALGLGEGFGKTMGTVTKNIKNSIPTNFDTSVSSDVSYGVHPVVSNFNPPDATLDVVSGAMATGESNSYTSNSESSATFAPVINITVEGSADEESVENVRTTLRDAVRELFMEFREEELERLSLKKQYAF